MHPPRRLATTLATTALITGAGVTLTATTASATPPSATYTISIGAIGSFGSRARPGLRLSSVSGWGERGNGLSLYPICPLGGLQTRRL